ncbi:hypothetical protein [Algoriphagus machipongonensis]|uniref:Uncharacterized protein n=1 Tax=Algoriphagus machipongonensis TaxID=388413 RepID=A3HTL2_9BACT|nr:hypothetical protein [Algoriphagus machipongonensis]EAZ83180.1 hypothetical protein ALPR1_13205 [Algoriphagus machipongonensis]
MSFLDDLKNVADTVKKDFESVEDELKKDMKSVLKDLEKDWESFEEEVKKILAEAEKSEADLFSKAKSYFDSNKDALKIEAIASTVKSDLTTLGNDLDKIKSSLHTLIDEAESQSSDDYKYLKDTYLKPIGKLIKDVIDEFDSVSVGITEEVSGIIGESQIVSLGYKFSGDDDVRISSQTGISFGAEEGAEVGVFLGIWTHGPKALKGAMFSFDLEGDDGVGVGVKVYFDVLALLEYMLDEALGKKNSDWGFRGIILIGTAGEVAEASGEISANMTYRVPN